MVARTGYEHHKCKMIEFINIKNDNSEWIPSCDLETFCDENNVSKWTVLSHIRKKNKRPSFIKRPFAPEFKFRLGQIMLLKEYKNRYPDSDI